MALLFVVLLLGTAWPTAIDASRRYPGAHWEQAASPQDAGWSHEKLAAARAYAESIDTAAVVIVEDGLIIDAWGPTALPLMCHSVRKSLLSAMYGPHVESGTIRLGRTLAQLGIDDNGLSLTDAEKQSQVGDLLKARSGIYHPALYETEAMAAARPKRGSHPRDTFWYYNNWDFNALGTIFENLTGRSLFEEFETRLAGPLEFEDFVRARHTHYVSGDDSVHPAYPFELSTRDLARFGLLYLRRGRWNDKQLVPEEWIDQSTASYSSVGSSGGYGYMWWVAVDGKHFPGVTLPEGSYSARGNRGQYLVVIPEWDLVVAHRVNSFQPNTRVTKDQFGKLLAMIVDARRSGTVQSEITQPAASQNTLHESSQSNSQNNSRNNTQDRAAVDEAALELILRGGEVIDGTGKARFRADVGIRNGQIVEVGDLADRPARRVIDVPGRIVAPGFIDLHSHADRGLVSTDPMRRTAPNLISQGITTVVINQDGSGAASILKQQRRMQQLGIGPNAIQMIGHGTIRRMVMKSDFRRPAKDDEIAAMRGRIRTAMEQGAFGLSAGLEYVPGRWSTPQEMQALVAELVPFQGVYIVHERSSGSTPMWFLPSRDRAGQPSMIDNLHELISIAEATKARVVATHIKARGADFWGSSRLMIEIIEKAREQGLELYSDQYAYNTSGSDGRIVLIPDWIGQPPKTTAAPDDNSSDANSSEKSARPSTPGTPAELLESALADSETAKAIRRDIAYEITRRGGAENILIVEHPQQELVGESLAELAQKLECEPVEAAIRLQLEGDRTRSGGARLRAFSMSQRDVDTLAQTPWTATSSDAGIALPTDEPVHPRFYGAFPRKICYYAVDRDLLTIEEAVRVSTSLPAKILGLKTRGVLRLGAAADMVVFDPKRIRDKADAFNPHEYCEGIDYVLVGGDVAVDAGRILGTLSGRVILRQEKIPDQAKNAHSETGPASPVIPTTAASDTDASAAVSSRNFSSDVVASAVATRAGTNYAVSPLPVPAPTHTSLASMEHPGTPVQVPQYMT